METKELETIIETLSDKLSIPIAHLWEVMTKGMQMQGIIDLIGYSIVIIIIMFSIYKSYKKIEARIKDDDQYDNGEFIAGVVVLNIIWAVMVLLLTSNS